MNIVTPWNNGRNVDLHRRHVAGMVRLEARPKRIAERAAAHRAAAEAHMEFVMIGKECHLELAMREYQLAYNEES